MKGNRIAYKEKELYITYIVRKRKRVKTATKRHKKRGYFVAPLITRKMYAYSAGCSLTFSAVVSVSSSLSSLSSLARLAM